MTIRSTRQQKSSRCDSAETTLPLVKADNNEHMNTTSYHLSFSLVRQCQIKLTPIDSSISHSIMLRLTQEPSTHRLTISVENIVEGGRRKRAKFDSLVCDRTPLWSDAWSHLLPGTYSHRASSGPTKAMSPTSSLPQATSRPHTTTSPSAVALFQPSSLARLSEVEPSRQLPSPPMQVSLSSSYAFATLSPRPSETAITGGPIVPTAAVATIPSPSTVSSRSAAATDPSEGAGSSSGSSTSCCATTASQPHRCEQRSVSHQHAAFAWIPAHDPLVRFREIRKGRPACERSFRCDRAVCYEGMGDGRHFADKGKGKGGDGWSWILFLLSDSGIDCFHVSFVVSIHHTLSEDVCPDFALKFVYPAK
jgi:hypothetical protein